MAMMDIDNAFLLLKGRRPIASVRDGAANRFVGIKLLQEMLRGLVMLHALDHGNITTCDFVIHMRTMYRNALKGGPQVR